MIRLNPSIYNEHIFAIAHELRTPLAVITGNTYTQLNALRKLYHLVEKTDDNVDLIRIIKDSIMSIECQIDDIDKFISLVSEYGLYNSIPESDRYLIHMKSYTDNLLSIAPTFSRSMAVFGDEGFGYGADDGKDFENIHCVINPQDLNRIVMNICTNAADAVSAEWKKRKYDTNFLPSLRIRCLKTKSPNETIELADDILGPFGCTQGQCSFFIVIEDNGPGISEENLSNIFKSGFSTKTNDDHTKSYHLGFGLNMCMKLAKRNDISIFIKTDLSGTKFFIGMQNIIVSNPSTCKNGKLLSTDEINSDFSILKFSKDSELLFSESTKNVNLCNNKTIFTNENLDYHKDIQVFDPKKRRPKNN